ncbi:MAG: ABC transporter permease subunit [Clostridia bacterium]|nr:ABC transporter permease subunit [Clostridia bacterium]MBN2883140.1 ABC transporter permease subunit [Clostridia bacterium]
MKRYWKKIAAIVVWLLIWLIAATLIDSQLKFPGPLETMEVLFLRVLAGDGFLLTVGSSLLRILLGLGLAGSLGLITGVAAGISKGFSDFMEPIVVVIKSTPVMSFIILAMIWFSFSTVPVVICFLMCFPIIYQNSREGILNTDKKLVEMADLYRVPKKKILSGIYLKSMKPYMNAAANVCLGLGFKVTVAAEVLASPKYGIGSKLYDAKIYLEPVEVFAWTFIILILSYLLEQLLRMAFRDRNKRRLENAPGN